MFSVCKLKLDLAVSDRKPRWRVLEKTGLMTSKLSELGDLA